jgi:cytochrome P450
MQAIPRVRGLPIVGSLLDVRRDRIGWQHRVAREHGDIARFRSGVFRGIVVSAPALAHQVLVEKADAFVKSFGWSVWARSLLGNGTLVSEHAFHDRQRRMLAPAFAPRRIEGYGAVMVERAERAAESMIAKGDIDMSEEAMRLTLEVVGKTLFDVEVGDAAMAISEALTASMKLITRSITSLVPIPPSVPTARHRELRRTVKRLDEQVYRLIRERRTVTEDRGDILSVLLRTRDEDGTSLTETQVRDEIMNLFLAGHETTASGIAWSLWLLGGAPEIEARAALQVRSVLGGRSPVVADLAAMPLPLQIFKEALRLYPPIYSLGRRAITSVELGGYAIEKGELVFVNVAGMHRRADIFSNPDTFDPDRFSPDREKLLPRWAYIPFGAGPRVCIGNHFATLEAHLVLATLLQRAVCERRGPEPHATALLTLRPRDGLGMRARRRK